MDYERIKVAFDGLKTYHKDVLRGHLADGKSYDAVAHSLSLNVGTVKSRINRAMTSVLTALDKPNVREERKAMRDALTQFFEAEAIAEAQSKASAGQDGAI